MKILVKNCNPKNGIKCKGDRQIKQYLKSFLWEINILQEQINFKQFNQKPVIKKIKPIFFGSIDFDVTRVLRPKLRKNTIEA